MTIDNQKLEFLRAKIGGLIRQVMEEEGIGHEQINVDIFTVGADLPEGGRDHGYHYAVRSKDRRLEPNLTLYAKLETYVPYTENIT